MSYFFTSYGPRRKTRKRKPLGVWPFDALTTELEKAHETTKQQVAATQADREAQWRAADELRRRLGRPPTPAEVQEEVQSQKSTTSLGLLAAAALVAWKVLL